VNLQTTQTTPWAILLAVGPGDVELERLRDLAESIAVYAGDVARIQLVDDAQRPARLMETFPPPLREKVRCVANLKVRGAVGWRDGLNVAIWIGLRVLAEAGRWSFVLKLDTDSLLIGPPRAPICRRFSCADQPSLIGYCQSEQTVEHNGWRIFEPYIKVMEYPICEYRDPITGRRKIYLGFGPRGFRRRRLLKAAKANGYIYSEHCQGGGYALHGDALDLLNNAGVFADCRLWANVAFTEDVALALTVRSAGLSLGHADGEGQAFGVRYRGLPAAPVELLERGNAVIHSVKSQGANQESEIRGFFKSRRSEDAAV